jgi:hypothetical protein
MMNWINRCQQNQYKRRLENQAIIKVVVVLNSKAVRSGNERAAVAHSLRCGKQYETIR